MRKLIKIIKNPSINPAFEKAQGIVTNEAPIREFQTLNIIVKEPC